MWLSLNQRVDEGRDLLGIGRNPSLTRYIEELRLAGKATALADQP